MINASLARQLEIYFYNSQRDLLKEVEDYWLNNPSEYDPIVQRPDTSDDYIRSNPEFYGYDPNSNKTLQEQFSYDEVKIFSDMPLLESALNGFSDIKRTLDLGGDFDSARMKFTSLPKGVFNFGIASKGLYRKVEYFDETHGIVIDSNLVLQSEIDNTPYYNFKGNRLYLRKQQEGTSLIEKHCEGVKVKYSDANMLYLPFKDGKIYNGCGFEVNKEKGIFAKLKYATTTKKVFSYREKLGGGISPFVDLFVVVGGLGTLETEAMLAKNLPTFIVADILEKAGVKVRIYGVRSYSKDDKIVFLPFALKEYGETIDFGSLASFTSDVRFFRVNLWRSTATIRRMAEKAKNPRSSSYPKGMGTTLYGYNNNVRDELYDVFQMYKNWVFNNKGSVKNTTKINDKGLMILGGLRNIQNSDKLTGRNQAQTFAKIKEEVYRMLDYVGMLLTTNPSKFIQGIYNREKDSPKYANYSIPQRKQEMTRYLSGLIRDNLQVVPDLNDPNLKVYETPKDEVLRIEERTKDLIKAIEKTLS
jgi:hypothetical protein